MSIRPLTRRSGFHTFDRWLYNAKVAVSPPRDADLVVGFDLDGFMWARRRQLPFVASLKGIVADELQNERGWVRALLGVQARWELLNTARADRVLVTSHYQAQVAHREYGVPADRLDVVPEPIDVDRWRADLERARRRERAGPVVLCVARLYPRKRIVDLLEASARMRDGVPGLEIRIVGDGPERAAVEARCHELGLAGTARILGDVSREQLVEEYANADCFCLPSVQEGFGIVFLEAMTAGLPVVACRAAAIPEVVLDGRTGVLVPPRDPAALARALGDLLAAPDRVILLGAAGRQWAASFTPERVARRFLDAVHSITEGTS
ncbi:MAG: glycosyltransferase family 4 protein [Candidatus Rokuibacteriota bacterium]